MRRGQVSGSLMEISFLALPQGPHRRAQLLVTWGAGRWLSLVHVDWSIGLVVGLLLVLPAVYEVVALEPLPDSHAHLASVEPLPRPGSHHRVLLPGCSCTWPAPQHPLRKPWATN